MVAYPAVCVSDTRELLATGEGTIQDGTVVGQHGDPELMATFAGRYLAAFHAVMPRGGPPRKVVDIMPALHLLVMAVELVLKADLMRSDKDLGNQHSLARLYSGLDAGHRSEADARFGRCEPNRRLKAAGERTAEVADVLTVYDQSYGGASKVYMDTRYYAEPTTKFRQSSGLRGANLVKAGTPYPIFLPHVVESLLETFRYFDGSARLRRLGADAALGSRAPGRGNHGEWGVAPASLGLVTVQVAQSAWMDDLNNELGAFRRWKRSRPPGYATSWMYGGSHLLFYRADKSTPQDCATEIDGIECRIWRQGRLGMHPRDLYLLADALEGNGVWDVLRV